MAEIINLKKARKARTRDQKRAAGAENAARFGRTRALKSLEKARREKAEATLDGHERESGAE